MPLRLGSEIPFSIEALHAMRSTGALSSSNSGAARVAPAMDSAHHHNHVATAHGEHARQWLRSPQDQRDRNRRARLASYESGDDDRCDRAFKCGQWFLLLLTICFVAVVVTLLSMVFVKVGQVLDTVGGSSMQAKVDRVLDHAMEAALHTETATANAAEMSALARNAVQEAHPRLIDALNQSSEMMEELRDFSMHPQWTLSTGNTGRRRRD